MTQPTKRIRRRKYMIDLRLQMAITAQLLGVMLGVGFLYVLGVFFLPGSEKLDALGSQDVRDVFLRANAIYFGLGAAILGTISMLLTHRIAGPAFVLQRALGGIRKGLYDHRLGLRKRDYLKPLAAAVSSLCDDLKRLESERSQGLDDLAHCLEENDVEGAKELIKKLRAAELSATVDDADADDSAATATDGDVFDSPDTSAKQSEESEQEAASTSSAS